MDTTAGGALIAALRNQLELTQEELAATAGVGTGMLRKIEQGYTRRPRPVNVRALDQALGAEGRVIAAFGRASPDKVTSSQPADDVRLQVDALTQVVRTTLLLLKETLESDEQLRQVADALRSLDTGPQRRAQ